MTAYDRLRKVYETAGPLAIAAPADVAALLDEHESLLAARVQAHPAVPEGYTPVRTDVLLWLLGENGDFECPPAQYFRGKPAPYFWRKKLRESMLPASPAQPAVPEDVAMDAARYRWLREHSQTGSVKTLLPLERCHYVVVHESAYEYQSFDDAIDAAIISATEGRKDE